MSVQTRRVAATPDRVWDVLGDGWLYSGWVVGTSHIRSVDEAWPNAGTRLHHSVGSWPIMISDSTRGVETQPPRMLVLQARAWTFRDDAAGAQSKESNRNREEREMIEVHNREDARQSQFEHQRRK